jgi:hypothetical protein
VSDVFGSGIAVSLPAKELAHVQLPGSVFGVDNLAAGGISDELRRAVWLIEQVCRSQNLALVFIARPEIFTHGETLQWLRRRLGDIQDHVSVSDGTTIRLIPGMHNHVFFHALGRAADEAAFGRLEQRVPELFFTLTSQINSALRIRHGLKKYTPPSFVISGRENQTFCEPEFYKFYLNAYSIEDSVARMLLRGASDTDNLPVKNIVYAPMTETGTADTAFAKRIALLIARTYLDPTSGLIIRLPFGADQNAKLRDRMAGMLTGLRHTRIPIPSVPAPNIFFATDDVEMSQLAVQPQSVDLLIHDSFDFWRHPPSFYAKFRSISVTARRGRHNPEVFTVMLTKACGRRPDLVWPARTQNDYF